MGALPQDPRDILSQMKIGAAGSRRLFLLRQVDVEASAQGLI